MRFIKLVDESNNVTHYLNLDHIISIDASALGSMVVVTDRRIPLDESPAAVMKKIKAQLRKK